MKLQIKEKIKCKAKKKDNTPCPYWAVMNGLCIMHYSNIKKRIKKDKEKRKLK